MSKRPFIAFVGLSLSVSSFLLDVRASAQSVKVDYRITIGTGHPEIFGGNRFPSDPVMARQVVEAGITLTRNDYYLEKLVPASSVNDYKNNINNVQDSSTWNWNGNDLLTQSETAQKMGVKVLMIMSYNTPWNSYSGTRYGVPVDWWVYEDIVKKIYLHFPADMVEVWNEPDNPQFFDIMGSPYATPQAAYDDIYYHAAHAIRSVDAHVLIGGPAMCCQSPSDWIPALLNDPRIPVSWINFLSYHTYGADNLDSAVVNVAAAEGRAGIPVYVTEWNAKDPSIDNLPQTVSFAGMRLADMFSLGLSGADFYAIQDVSRSEFAFYTTGELLPAARVWLLMSKKLALGADVSRIKKTTWSGVTAAVGAINSSGQYTVTVVNHSGKEMKVAIVLRNLGFSGNVELQVYRASSNDDAQNPIESRTQTVMRHSLSQLVNMPAYSVVGITVSATALP